MNPTGPDRQLLLVRVAPEVATKARRTRRRFQLCLAQNLRDALRTAGCAAEVRDRWGRIFVEASDPSAAGVVATVFGVASLSLVETRCPAALDEIVRVGELVYAERVRGRTFAVRARRSGREAFRTRDVMVQLGAALDRYGDVNLDRPDVTVSVEARDGEALFFSDHVAGAGGLPIGAEGRAVTLFSGGFDSPVAAWMLLKRGVALDYVFCNLGGEAYERSVVSVAKILADRWSHGYRPVLHAIDFTRPLEELRRGVEPRYRQVVLKRLMYRAAEAVARELRAPAIVTGESVGQVSSQTLDNLRAIGEATALPVFRPLIGLDKLEIIARARAIGTAALSAHVREYCAIEPSRPVTHASPGAARGEEARVNLAVLDEAVAARKRLDLRALTATDLVQPYLFAREVPDGAVVLDCREPQPYEAWHWPRAERWDPVDLAERFPALDKTRRYILYCTLGLHSGYLAEAMQRAGYEAYSFEGGVRQLQAYARSRGIQADRIPAGLGPS
jgi:tRNA uracil 4-sulfurtransferase